MGMSLPRGAGYHSPKTGIGHSDLAPVGERVIWITAALGPLFILPQTLKLVEDLEPLDPGGHRRA